MAAVEVNLLRCYCYIRRSLRSCNAEFQEWSLLT